MEHPGTAAIEAGTRLGNYEIGRLVGVGSMGSVYEGLRAETGTRVAIKVLSPELEAVPAARARFLKEAKLTARVRHSHIVNVTDVGEDTGRSYLVMDMLEGEDLARRLARSGPLTVTETADLLLPVCEAVAAAHDRAVTHRDLKPSNIFLALRGGHTHPIVLDFGIAQDDEGGETGATTAKGVVFGTPYYLSPEQVADHRAAGPASDQYALGVILYECLTGQRPFVGETIEEVFRAIVAGKPTAPSALRPEISAAIDAVVLRAMHVDPKARFASVAELGRALRPFAAKASTEVFPSESAGEAEKVLADKDAAAQASGEKAPRPSVEAATPAAKADPATPTARRRAPSSPAIEVEAATPTPFVRTLTPEIEALGGPWFAAPESPEEPTGEPTIPTSAPTERPWVAADWARQVEGLPPSPGTALSAAGASLELATIAGWRAKISLNRRWIGAAAGAALGVVALAILIGHGRSAPRQPLVAPAASTPVVARPEPAAQPSPVERVAVRPARPAAPPSAAVAEPAAPAAAAEPVAAPSAPVVDPVAAPAAQAAPAEAVTARATAAAAEPVPARAAPSPAKVTPSAKVAPSEEPPAARSAPTSIANERAGASPRPAPDAPRTPAVREATEKPRPRASSGVRMHNGVPLLD